MQQPFDGADFPYFSQIQTTPMVIIRDVAYADIVQLVVYRNLQDEFRCAQKTLVSSSYKIYIDASLVTELEDFVFVCIFVPLHIFVIS